MRALLHCLDSVIRNLARSSKQRHGDGTDGRARLDLREQVRARHLFVEQPVGGQLGDDLLVATLR